MRARQLIRLVAVVALLISSCAGESDRSPIIGASFTSESYGSELAFAVLHEVGEEPPAMPAEFGVRTIVELDDGHEAVGIVDHPGVSDAVLIIERNGVVLEMRGGNLADGAWLDLSERIDSDSNYERGLLGLALGAGHAYVSFTDLDGTTNLVQFELADDGTPVLDSEELLLEVDQPRATHNGGKLQIDAHGNLWMALGDGGVGSPRWNSQDPTNLLGTILRIRPTPDEAHAYEIPGDNPFVDHPTYAPEVWAYGVRNPWRFWFDDQRGELWIADVGQAAFEEINLVPYAEAGANLGWPWYEGLEPYEPDDDTEPEGSPPSDLWDPMLTYRHSALGCAVIGGEVLRGGHEELDGAYLFGDLCGGHLVALWPDAAGREDPVEVVTTVPSGLTSIAVIDGAVLLTTREPGALHVLEPSGEPSPLDSGQALR